MAELSLADITQLYGDTICRYKGEPVRVIEVTRDSEMKLILLRHGKNVTVKFDQDLFGPPLGRIGFVNEGTHATYIMRNPVRRFQVGLNRGNIKMTHLPITDRRKGERDYNALYKMNTKSWAKALDNEYPSLAEALRISAEHKGTVAFDREFAVCSNRIVYYKTTPVGHVPPRMSTLKRIVFQDKYAHLDTLLIYNYDKTTRTIAAEGR